MVVPGGVTIIDCRLGFTVNCVDPETVPDADVITAVMVAVQGLMAVAKPVVEITAPVVEELQVTKPVITCVDASEYVPVAVNCWVPPPTVMAGLCGVTSIEDRVGSTFSVVSPKTVPTVALMVVVPTATPVAVPALEIVAVPGSDDSHVTELVRVDTNPSS